MQNWTESKPGYESKTIQRGACTITIHRPILTAPEREKREQQAMDATVKAMTEYIRRKERRGQEAPAC